MIFWFDVEDLIVHFQHISRPTGIQRLTFEIYREVWKLGGATGEVRFCRHGATPAEYLVVDWPRLEAGILAASSAKGEEKLPQQAEPMLAELELTAPLQEETPGTLEPGLSDPAGPQPSALEPSTLNPSAIEPPAAPPPLPPPTQLNFRGRLHDYLYPRLNPTIRIPLGVIYRSQKQSLLAIRDLFRAFLVLAAAPKAPPAKLGEVTIRLSTQQVKFAPDDVFVSLGASWGRLNAAAGRHVQELYGLRYAVLIHDLIPELYPEWTSREGLPSFRAWLRDVVPYADVIFAVSRHSAQDLQRRMVAWNHKVPAPVVLPVGHRKPPRAKRGPSPFDRKFILFVSTIEVRKNHALLFRVWRRLLETMPKAQVPYLVFAGKVAWLTKDLLVQLENANWLDGHIKLVESPSEPALAALYEHCEFTVFPSLYEGWGLPVTESLSFGKTVAASDRAAIPEAGGEYCRYFDPENVGNAYEVIRSLIENPEKRRLLEARIAAEFHPPSWADTAATLLRELRAAGKPGGEATIGVMAAA